ncbi:MAG: hypothetical protein JXR88_14535 [Clostridia bacterium]|nr:hypothetical protein [Clostridia bacterium]
MPINKPSLTKGKVEKTSTEVNSNDSTIAIDAMVDKTAVIETFNENNSEEIENQRESDTEPDVIESSKNMDVQDNELKKEGFDSSLVQADKAPVFVSVKAKQKSGIAGDSGLLSIVNPEDNTKCLLIKNELIDSINASNEIVFNKSETELMLTCPKTSEDNSFRLRKRGKNYVVYSAELVEEIAKHFKLDYSNGRTCRTFGEVRYDKEADAAYVKIK